MKQTKPVTVSRCTEVPSAPRNLSVAECGKDYVDLWWECPDTDGGSPVVQYIVEKCDVSRAGGGVMWTVCGTVAASELSVRVGKLLQGNSYLFRVSAENRVGSGPPTELQEPVVAELPYGACFCSFLLAELSLNIVNVVVIVVLVTLNFDVYSHSGNIEIEIYQLVTTQHAVAE